MIRYDACNIQGERSVLRNIMWAFTLHTYTNTHIRGLDMSSEAGKRASGCCWPMDLAAFCTLASSPMFALFIISDRIAFDLSFDSYLQSSVASAVYPLKESEWDMGKEACYVICYFFFSFFLSTSALLVERVLQHGAFHTLYFTSSLTLLREVF